MKLVRKCDNTINDKRLTVINREVPCLDSEWHFHAEYELLYISSSFGIRFVGDCVSEFGPGDLVLVGAYLPHLWRNDITFYSEETSEKEVKTTVVKFTDDFLGKDTFTNPEFIEISKLLTESNLGLSFGKNTALKLHKEILELPHLSRIEQCIQLLKILNELTKSSEKSLLSSTDMRQFTGDNTNRIDKVIKYISDNYASDISLQDIADVSFMTTNSFCRFFKKMTNKSFTQFLNEVRIRNASRMLIQKEESISSICFAVGYNSKTNFNKQFKQIMNITPNQYRQSI